ncbi:MAG: hypothetical protein AAFR23_03900 [Pseudomonadota bacterium]
MLLVAHLFVTTIFLIIGGTFIATTATLAWEFWDNGWLDFLSIDSHLFVFFPTFGIVALCAFYLPSVAFVDHYWRRVWFGKFRFFGGMIVLIGLSQAVAWVIIDSENHSPWQVKPSVLLTDRGTPSGCLDSGDVNCRRVPVLTAIGNLRDLSQNRLGVREFIRDCNEDGLVRIISQEKRVTFCPALTPFSLRPELVDDATCCQAQARLVSAINAFYQAGPQNHSITGQVHAALLPFKIFFMLVLVAISTLFLTLRFEAIQKHYRRNMLAIDIGLIVGTIATLFLPLMSQAFVQSLIVLVGPAGRGPFSEMVPYITVAFLVWSLLVITFFLRRESSQTEKFLKVSSFVGAGIGLLKYEVIVDYVVRLIGSGAELLSVGGLVLLSLAMVLVIYRLWTWSVREAEGRNIFTGRPLKARSSAGDQTSSVANAPDDAVDPAMRGASPQPMERAPSAAPAGAALTPKR